MYFLIIEFYYMLRNKGPTSIIRLFYVMVIILVFLYLPLGPPDGSISLVAIQLTGNSIGNIIKAQSISYR